MPKLKSGGLKIRDKVLNLTSVVVTEQNVEKDVNDNYDPTTRVIMNNLWSDYLKLSTVELTLNLDLDHKK